MLIQHQFLADKTTWGATFDALADCPDLCVTILDRQGRIVAINGPGLRLLGRDPDDGLCGTVWDEMWTGANRDSVRRAVADALEGRPSHHRLAGDRVWDIETMPHSGGAEGVEAVLVVSRPADADADTSDPVPDGAGNPVPQALHDLANVVNATSSLSRLLRRGVPPEDAGALADDLYAISAKGTRALARLGDAARRLSRR